MRSPAREAFSTVPETCPDIDQGAQELGWKIKEEIERYVAEIVKRKTGELRDALVQAIADKQHQEARAEKAEWKISDLESDIERLKRDIEHLEAAQ